MTQFILARTFVVMSQQKIVLKGEKKKLINESSHIILFTSSRLTERS